MSSVNNQNLINSYVLPSVNNLSCATCNAVDVKLSRCNGCKRIYFCNTECQKKAWKTHQLACRNHLLIPKEEEIVCQFSNSQGLHGIQQHTFKELTGTIYVSTNLFSKASLTDAKFPTHKIVSRESPKSWSSVALKDSGNGLGLGLVAINDIRSGEKICVFGGEAVQQEIWYNRINSSKSELYSIDASGYVLNPEKYASLGVFVNDGFPSCEFKNDFTPTNYPNDICVPFEYVLVAVREIKKGEELFIDYGPQHPIKKAPYLIADESMKMIIQKYGENLDSSILAKMGWVSSSLDERGKVVHELQIATELEYIFTTPLVLALLHLHTNLDPLKTLESFKGFSQRYEGVFKKQFAEAEMILSALSKVPKEQKMGFAKIVSTISQRAFVDLSSVLLQSLKFPKLEECSTFGKVLDDLRVTCFGTLNGCFWRRTEEDSFRKAFCTPEWQKKLADNREINDLPEPFKEKYYTLKADYLFTIKPYL